MSTQDRLETLIKWCEINQVQIDPRLQLRDNTFTGCGIGVYCQNLHVERDVILVRIPRDAVLSVKSCSFSALIPSAPFGIGAQLSLSLALYGEIMMGVSSRWHGYIQSFPDGIIDLPLFWNALKNHGLNDGTEALKWLRGTQTEKLTCQLTESRLTVLEEITRYFYDTVKVVVAQWTYTTTKPFPQPELLGFYRAYSLVSSRAFIVDAYNFLSMVPIADAFNHDHSNHVHLESDYNVCPDCGSLQKCIHDDRDELASGILSIGKVDQDLAYEMVSNSFIHPDTEVYNTYGESLTNAHLLAQYGFTLDVNDNDRLSWSLEEVCKAVGCSSSMPNSQIIGKIIHSPQLPQLFNRAVESELIYYEHEGLLCLNGDGKISLQMWILLALTRIQPSWTLDANVGEAHILLRLHHILALHTQIEMEDGPWVVDAIYHGTGPDPVPRSQRSEVEAQLTIAEIARAVITLCDTRKRTTGQENFHHQDVGNLLDTLSPRYFPRSRLALSIVIGELSILDSCEAAWTEFCNLMGKCSFHKT